MLIMTILQMKVAGLPAARVPSTRFKQKETKLVVAPVWRNLDGGEVKKIEIEEVIMNFLL